MTLNSQVDRLKALVYATLLQKPAEPLAEWQIIDRVLQSLDSRAAAAVRAQIDGEPTLPADALQELRISGFLVYNSADCRWTAAEACYLPTEGTKGYCEHCPVSGVCGVCAAVRELAVRS